MPSKILHALRGLRAHAAGLLAAAFAFCTYLTTLAPSIGWEEDSGELAAAFSTLGIPHPSGYPAFTPVAWLFSRLPLGDRPVWRLNLLVALLTALAVYLFWRLFLFLLSEEGRALFGGRGAPNGGDASSGRRGVRAKSGKPTAPSPSAASSAAGNAWAAAAAVLVLAFSRTFWTEAVSIEVYAMHLVLTATVILLFLRALSVQARRPEGGPGWRWHAFALALGLSFAHHLMTVMLAPALLYLFVVRHGVGRAAWTRLGVAVPAFLAGLAAYLYLPLRAAQGPLMNWGDPSTPERFWFHVTGRQYSYKMFESTGAFREKLAGFLSAFPAEFGYVPLLAAAIGAVLLFRRSRRLFLFVLLLFLGGLFFALNYGFDDPNFYLNVHAATAAWVAFGLAALTNFPAVAASRSRTHFAGAACVLLAAVPLAANHAKVDQSGNHAVEDYARNVFASLDSGAVVLTGQYAYFTAPGFYLQLAEGVRPDVLILDTQLLKFPWYYAQLERRAPDLLRDCRPEVEAFLRANARFEDGGRLDSASFMRFVLPEYQAVVRRLADRAAASRPLFATPETRIPDEWGYRQTPSGLVFRFTRASDGAAPRYAPRTFDYRRLPDGPGAGMITRYYATGYLNQGLYHGVVLGDRAAGTALLRRALSVDPGFFPARQWLARLSAPGE